MRNRPTLRKGRFVVFNPDTPNLDDEGWRIAQEFMRVADFERRGSISPKMAEDLRAGIMLGNDGIPF